MRRSPPTRLRWAALLFLVAVVAGDYHLRLERIVPPQRHHVRRLQTYYGAPGSHQAPEFGNPDCDSFDQEDWQVDDEFNRDRGESSNANGQGTQPPWFRAPCRSSSDELGDDTPPMDDRFAPLSNNEVTLPFYVALKPAQPSLGRLLTKILTEYLNETNADFIMYLPLRRADDSIDGEEEETEDEQQPDANNNNNNNNLEEEEDDDDDDEEEEEEEEDGNNGRRRILETAVGWDMVHLHTDPDLLKKYPDVWWWHYDLVYACYWSMSKKPVTNETIRQGVTDYMIETLQNDTQSGKFQEWVVTTYGQRIPALALSVTADNLPADVGEKIGDDSHPSLETGAMGGRAEDYGDVSPFAQTLDPRTWDWERYTGLGVFCATFLFTCCLMQLAVYRQRRLRAQALWGNLGTEAGVDELLRTGWKVRGSKMEVFDKSKLGYEDDDSLFMGGFEQKEQIVGAEITVTQPESTTLEDHTRSGSSKQ